MASSWRDGTSYSQGEKDRTPRVWAFTAGRLRLRVHRLHGCGDTWFVTCEPFLDQAIIGNGTADEAKDAALVMIRSLLEDALEVLDRG